MTLLDTTREIPIFVLGEAQARATTAHVAADGSVLETTFTDSGGAYEFVDLAMLGGVDYVALFRSDGGPGPDFIAYGNTETAEPPPPAPDPAEDDLLAPDALPAPLPPAEPAASVRGESTEHSHAHVHARKHHH